MKIENFMPCVAPQKSDFEYASCIVFSMNNPEQSTHKSCLLKDTHLDEFLSNTLKSYIESYVNVGQNVGSCEHTSKCFSNFEVNNSILKFIGGDIRYYLSDVKTAKTRGSRQPSVNWLYLENDVIIMVNFHLDEAKYKKACNSHMHDIESKVVSFKSELCKELGLNEKQLNYLLSQNKRLLDFHNQNLTEVKRKTQNFVAVAKQFADVLS